MLKADWKAIVNWLAVNGALHEDTDGDSRQAIPDVDDEQTLQEWSLMNVATTETKSPFDNIENEITDAIYILLHLISCCLLAQAGKQRGLVTDTLGERISSSVLATVIHAVTTESFSLGSMSALSKTRLHPWLSQTRELASDCPLDPTCAEDPEGVAYDVCTYISEILCEYFNHASDRRLFEGDDGLVRFWMREVFSGMDTVGGTEQDVVSTADGE